MQFICESFIPIPSDLFGTFVRARACRNTEPSSALSFCLKCFRGRLYTVLVIGSMNITSADLLNRCKGEQREPVAP
jgi:hypothetical protein